MTTTLNEVNLNKEKKPEPSAEEIAASELVRLAKEKGLSLTGPDGLLKQFTKTVLETALEEELTDKCGQAIWGDRQALEERVGRVHSVPGLRRRDPHRDLLDERDRVVENPIPPSSQGQRGLLYGREGRLDRLRGPPMDPVLGRVVREREEHTNVVGDLRCSFGPLGP